MHNCIQQLFEINLNILAVVSDQGSNFFKLTKELNVSIECPYFFVGEHSVLYF